MDEQPRKQYDITKICQKFSFKKSPLHIQCSLFQERERIPLLRNSPLSSKVDIHEKSAHQLI
jgi:hypothetical protein